MPPSVRTPDPKLRLGALAPNADKLRTAATVSDVKKNDFLDLVSLGALILFSPLINKASES